MSPAAWLVVGLVVLAIVVLLMWGWSTRAQRRAELQNRFGSEYDRVVRQTGSESKAERELRRREERHDALAIRPLPPEQRTRYSQMWGSLQAQFVDDPVRSLQGADMLVQRVMAERGYPTGDVRQQAADLSVEHAGVLDHYRAAHAVDASPRTSTEQLREAMVHYRELFASLLADGQGTSDERTRSRR